MTPDAGSAGTIALPTAATTPIDVLLTGITDQLAIAVVDEAGRIHHWSPGCEALYGWRAEDAIGAKKHDLLQSSPSKRAAAWPVPAGSPARTLAEIHRDGRTIRVLEKTLPLATTGFYALSMMHDPASDNHWADDSRRIAIAVEMHAIGIFSYDIATQQFDWVQHSWRPHGVERGSLPFAEFMEGARSAAMETIVAACREAVSDGSGFVELALPIAGDTIGSRTVRFRAQLVRDPHGRVDRFVGVMQDMTDADIRERSLRDREAELSAILETVSDAMFVVDCTGIIGAFSRAAQDLLGYDVASMIGRSIDPLVEGGWPAIVAATVAGGRREMRMIVANGDRLPVDLRAGLLPDADPAGHILFFSDISERKARELRRSLFERTARDTAMAEFAAHMMHELNQPLAAASNFLAVAQQLVLKPDWTADVGGVIDMALGQIQRVGGIIRSTHQKAAGENMHPRTIPVLATIEEAVALVYAGRGNCGVEITIDVHPTAETMFVDPVGIQQVLTNLLRNAIEAFGPTPEDGAWIAASSRRQGDLLVLSVDDNGPGIPPELIPGLFEPFAPREKKGGMGLGLSICRTIVEAHGGTLTAENLPDGGASFTLILPHDEHGTQP